MEATCCGGGTGATGLGPGGAAVMLRRRLRWPNSREQRSSSPKKSHAFSNSSSLSCTQSACNHTVARQPIP